jgi:hypothetical protein
VEVPPPAAGKGSVQSSTPPDLYPGQDLTPEAAAREVAPQPEQPAAPAYEPPMQSGPSMPGDGQSLPSMPSMPLPQDGGSPTPSQPMPVNPSQSPLQPNSPPSMPAPQGNQMPSVPPVSDQLR